MVIKKRKAPVVDFDSESSSDEEAFEKQGEEEIDVDFEFFDPEEIDFHSVKNFVIDLHDGEEWDSSSLADTIVNQGNIGTCVKADNKESDSLFALLTCINMRQYKDVVGIQQLKKQLIAKGKQNGCPQLEELLNDPNANIGLVINERLINMPLDIVPPLHKAMKEDIEWSCSAPEKDMPRDEQPFYRFDHLVFMSKFQGKTKGEKRSKKRSKKAAEKLQKKHASAGPEGANFIKWEDEMYLKHATMQFHYGLAPRKSASNTSTASDVSESRLVYVLPRKSLDKVVKELNQ